MNTKKVVMLAWALCVVTLGARLAFSQQQSQERQQRPPKPVPPASELFYRTFTAAQLARDDQATPVRPGGRGAPSPVPNTANVIEEIFARGLGPIVLGRRGQRNPDGSARPVIVLNGQKDVYARLRESWGQPSAPSRAGASGGGDGATAGRPPSQPSSEQAARLVRNLLALKINMIICENGITVNDPGWRFGNLSLSPGYGIARRPWIYENCEQCNAACPGPCFMTSELNCRCYLEHLRTAGSSPAEVDQLKVPRRLRDLAAYADDLLTKPGSVPAEQLDAINGTIELVNAAFSTDLPFRRQDVVQWGGEGGRLVVSSVRPLSTVPFLVAE